jgi:hypothetical protein
MKILKPKYIIIIIIINNNSNDIKDILNQLHYEMYRHLITLNYICVFHMLNWFH